MTQYRAGKGVFYNDFMACKIELPMPLTFIKKEEYKQNESTLLCCWRAVGSGDKLSMWMRSVDFKIIYSQYKRLIEQGRYSITDLTVWSDWEKRALENIGIKLVDPRNGDLLDVYKHVIRASNIFSIDTMLGHLCAAMNTRVNLVLPINSDERWINLLSKDNCYKQNCTITRQLKYGEWGKEIISLFDELIKKVQDK